jgi:hypothetical protein
MCQTDVRVFVMNLLAVMIGLGVAPHATAQSAAKPGTHAAKPRYSKMEPVEKYLMADRVAEIALARTAAPKSISQDADVLVLGPHGFENAVKGKNGFVCIVGRGWTAAADSDYWDPKVRVPMCVNAAAAGSYLVRVKKETEWGLAGQTQAQMTESIKTAIAKRELPPMEPGAMCYMTGKQGYGGDTNPHWPSHLMFFFNDTDLASWGANLPGSPVIGLSDPMVEHLTQFVIEVQQWSDGTEAHKKQTTHTH